MVPAIRSHVILHRASGSGDERKHIAYDALVIGHEGDLLTLVFIDPAMENRLNDVNFSDAFERVFSVPHESANSQGHYFYTLTTDGTDAVLQSMADAGAKGRKPRPVASGK
jgi:hypothetical protein